MSFETVSPNMMLTIPGVALTSSPAWAEDLNNSLTLIDSHDHSAGQGVQITPSGLNINAEFPINSNDLTEARSVRFTSQGSVLSLPADLGCIYVSGADLYYNDTAGNHVRITQAGAVVGTPGSITALTSPASATYVSGSGTFVWQQAVNTAANMDMASAIIRKTSALSAGITIAAPVGLASDYTFTLPAAPPSTLSVLGMDPSGNVTATNIAVTPNIAVSSSCGNFTTVSGTPVDVTNLSLSITTTGRPVYLSLQSDTGGSAVEVTNGISVNGNILTLLILRDGVEVGFVTLASSTAVLSPLPFLMFDLPSAGAHTYKIQAFSDTSTVGVRYARLLAYEIS